MFYGAIIVRPNERRLAATYANRDHQQECLRRLAAQEPNVKLFATVTRTELPNALRCFI